MKVLIVGAGAVGAYFGARLLETGADATFLVRPKRQAQLGQGLVVRSPHGDIRLAPPATVTADRVQKGFGLVLLSCKAYDLAGAIESFAPAVDSGTVILPLLNGMRHLDILKERFGAERVMGGLAVIAATLGEDGSVIHLNDVHSLTFGELDNSRTPRAQAIEAVFAKAKFQSRLSDAIVQEMWEKWVFIAALAGSTCLMRAAVGDIVRSGNTYLLRRILHECASIAAVHGFEPRPQQLARSEGVLTDANSTLTASMLRDIERGARTEADHVIGDLLSRRGAGPPEGSLLDVAFAQLKSHELRQAREAAAGAARAPA